MTKTIKTAPAKSAPSASGAGMKASTGRKAGRRAARAPAGPFCNLSESPLTWLARRTGRDGRPLVDATQLAAGERLRLDFTRAGLTPRITSNWSPVPGGGGGPEAFTDMVLAAKHRVSAALTVVGPELSGVLMDVCCFLKGLEEVESDRGWPARTAKVVLGLALDRLAAHYGLSRSATGRARAPLRAWHDDPGPDEAKARPTGP